MNPSINPTIDPTMCAPSDGCRPSVLMLSKPVVPPWNDSSKNLVRDLSMAGRRYRYHVLTTGETSTVWPADAVVTEPIFASEGSFTPALSQNVRVFKRLLARDRAAIAHFFFAPNLKSSLAARAALIARPRPSVQTVCSVPRSFDRVGLLFFADRVVTVSRHTRDRLRAAGLAAHRVTHIPPGIRLPAQRSPHEIRAWRESLAIPKGSRLVLYPGDYQFSSAAFTVARAAAKTALPARTTNPRDTFVFACRLKQAASRHVERRIQGELFAAGVRDRVRFLNDVPDMLGLLAAADLVVLPAESLYAKMDLPLVLIEALALGKPIVVAAGPPLDELLKEPVGVAVPPDDPEALAYAIGDIFASASRYAAMQACAREFACQSFAIEHVARRYEALYDELALAGAK